MDCCNYMEYQLQSIYNYNRAQYNDTGGGGYLNGGGYHHPPPPPNYCSYNNGYHPQNNTGPYNIPPNNPFVNDFNPNLVGRPIAGGYHHGYNNSMGYHHQYHPHVGHGGPPTGPPPPPPLPPPAQLWGATDYIYNPKEARVRKAQRDALRSRQTSTTPSLHASPQHRSYTPLPSTSHQMQTFMPTYAQQPLGSNVGSISGGGIINATSSGSRPSSVAPTTPRKPPPPYPGTRQSFSALDANRDFTMGYGDQSAFSPFQNIYSNGPSISEHSNSLYDMRYQNNANLDPTGMSWNGIQNANTNVWNQNYEMEVNQSNIEGNYSYQNDTRRSDSTLLNEQSHVSACDTASSSELSNNLDPLYTNSVEVDVYNYHKNILEPKDLNIPIKQEDTKDELTTPRSMEQFPQINTSISYNSTMYKQEIMSHVSSYHPKMSPKPTHSEETRMSPYNRPTHSPKTTPSSLNDQKTSKDLLNYRISPKTSDNKMSPKRHNNDHKNKSPKLKGSNHSSSPKSPKVQTSTNSNHQQTNQIQNIKVEEPVIENKHPLPAFTKAFSGTERGRLLATPELNNSNTSDPLQTNNPSFEYLNMDLFEDDEQKINFEEINELSSNSNTFTDTI